MKNKRKYNLKKFIYICILASIIFSSFSSLVLALTKLEDKKVDENTTDSYINYLVSNEAGTRNTGKIWADKTVLENNIQLDLETDGYDGEITSNSDFLHVYSALGSSQQFFGEIPVNFVIVIDNSGSMYANSNKWGETRIALTVEAVNKTIDSLMRINSFNEVAVILFGDGENSTGKGTNAAKTIIPMRHYDYGENNKCLEYLKSGWEGGSGNNPNHTNPSSNGFVYVNNKLIFDKDGYTEYENGTTNIQAGIYQGMQELLNAKNKSFTVGDVTINRKPSLLVLTDGQATDGLKGLWSKPLNSSNSMEAIGFLNDFSERNSSFVGSYTNSSGELAYSWNQFIQKTSQPGYKYEILGEANANDKHFPTSESVAKLKQIGSNFESSQGYLLLSTLMTAAYMKKAVSNAYKEDLEVYTLSVDVPDPSSKEYNAKSTPIGSNPFMMNPNKYFNQKFLEEKGYLKGNNTSYATDSVGYHYVLAVKDAIDNWNLWKKGQNTNNKISIYQSINTGATYDQDSIYGYQGTPKHTNFWLVNSVQNVSIPHLTNDSNNPYKLKDSDIDINYVQEAFYVSTSSEAYENIENVFNTVINEITRKPFKPVNGHSETSIDYLTYIDTLGDYMEIKNDDININGEKNDMSMLLFGELYNINQYGIYDPEFISSKSDFQVGWYDEKGNLINEENDDNQNYTYYIDYQKLTEMLPNEKELDKNKTYKVYNFSDEDKDIYKWNTAYGESLASSQEDLEKLYKSNTEGVYKLSDIIIYTEKEKKEIPNEILYVKMPASILPLQLVKITLSSGGKLVYQDNLDNKKESTPIRLFYNVGVQDNILSSDKSEIDQDKLSKKNIKSHSFDGNISFISNEYSNINIANNTRGDTTLYFTPNYINKYYYYQQPLMIYEANDNDQSELKLNDDEDYSKFLSSHKLIKNDNTFNKDKSYYVIMTYYIPDLKAKKSNNSYESTRYYVAYLKKGDDLIDNKLCWYNPSTLETYNFNDNLSRSNDLVLAIKPGTFHEEEIKKDIYLKNENITSTANTYAMTMLNNNLVVNYLGNNGVLLIKEKIENPKTGIFTILIPFTMILLGGLELKKLISYEQFY